MKQEVLDAPLISVIVRCFNEEKHIGKLLYGIERQRYDGPVEIIVVDSGSTDDTVAIAERFTKNIVAISPDEFSFGRALNIGCENAKGEYLIFASAHVYPLYDDWLSSIVAPFVNSKIALCYGKQRGDAATQFSEEQVFRHWFPEQSSSDQETPFCNNANCAIRRELWERFPYDETLTGLEDLDWARRMKDEGYTIAYSAEAVVAHVHEETPKQILNRYMREAIALKRIYPDQSMSVLDYSSLLVKNIASDYVRAGRSGRLGENLVRIPLFRMMQFTGAFLGLRRAGPLSEKLKQTFYYPNTLRSGHASQHRERTPIDYTGGIT